MRSISPIPPREITIFYRSGIDDKCHHISVRDNGSGISESAFSSIFEPFQLADAAKLSRRYDRIGLSLSITKKIMQMHGGDITVESSPEYRKHVYSSPAKSEAEHPLSNAFLTCSQASIVLDKQINSLLFYGVTSTDPRNPMIIIAGRARVVCISLILEEIPGIDFS